MLTVHQLSKSYQLTTLLRDVTFSVNPGDRLGLIGPNGSGKTTLLRILAGEESADSGHIARDPALRIGYLPQGFAPARDATVQSVIATATDDAALLEAELADAAAALAREPDSAEIQQQYDAVLLRLARSDPGAAGAVLAALELDGIDGATPVSRLSGGQKTRLALALVLLGAPELLLLDEPTNHLDIAMLEWLEEWLDDFPGGVLLVSHDRTFLDRTCTAILDLDPHTQQVRTYPGNYSDYLDQRRSEQEKQLAAYRDQVYEIRRMQQDIQRERQRGQRIHDTTSSRQPDLRVKAKKAMRRAKSREKKLARYEADADRVEKPARSWQMKLEMGEAERLGRSVLALERLVVGYSAESPLLGPLDLEVRAGERIALTGPNGSGKTTLLRTLAGALPPLAGSARRGASVVPGYMTQEQEHLDPAATPLATIQAVASLNDTDARAFLHYFLFTGDEAVKPNAMLSYGQRARLALARLVAGGCNLLLLDEPINHLDIASRTQFEAALSQFDGTTIMVVHDRYFIERFATTVWRTADGGVTVALL